MYHGQGMKLPEIRAALATELGFQARCVVRLGGLLFGVPKLTLSSEKQFRDRFRKWGLNTKNTKRQLKDNALAGLIDGMVRVSSNVVYLPDGAEIPMHKVMRHRADRLREARRARK